MPTFRHPADGCLYVTPKSFAHSEPCLDPPEGDDGCPHCSGEVQEPNTVQGVWWAVCLDEDCGWSGDDGSS